MVETMGDCLQVVWDLGCCRFGVRVPVETPPLPATTLATISVVSLFLSPTSSLISSLRSPSLSKIFGVYVYVSD